MVLVEQVAVIDWGRWDVIIPGIRNLTTLEFSMG